MITDKYFKLGTAASLLAAIDGNLKGRAEKLPGGKPVPFYHTGITIRQVHNPGFLMGKYGKDPAVVEAVTRGLLGLFLLGSRSALDGREGRLKAVSANLIAAGAASNVRDRIRNGYVTDYISLPVKGFEKITFNLGDVMIVSGSMLYLLSGITGKDK